MQRIGEDTPGTRRSFRQRAQDSLSIGLIAFSSSVCVQVCFHPLDVLKVRFQSHDGRSRNLTPKYHGVWDGFRQIYCQEGIRGFFKGAVASIASQSVARVLFFTCYEARKAHNQKVYTNQHLVVVKASCESSIFSLLFVQPLFVIKNRLILSVTSQNSFRSMQENVQEIIRSHNYQGFYRGMLLSIMLSSHGIILMYTYEVLKEWLGRKQFSDNLTPLLSGVVSKTVASTVLYPLATLRTRIQQNQHVYLEDGRLHTHAQGQKYLNNRDCFRKIYSLEGLPGFYKGYVPNLLKSVPSKGFFFYFYEYFKNKQVPKRH